VVLTEVLRLKVMVQDQRKEPPACLDGGLQGRAKGIAVAEVHVQEG